MSDRNHSYSFLILQQNFYILPDDNNNIQLILKLYNVSGLSNRLLVCFSTEVFLLTV